MDRTRQAVKRNSAENNILISLISFGLTVVIVRVFLQLAGYPQVGSSVLHIAHAIWGGLLLFIAVLLVLIVANPWALTVSAVLSGVGVGLFIDEVGKFITQKNDYFFPPAAPLIYSLFLLVALLFLLVRRSRQRTPRSSMYGVLSGLNEVLDNDLDSAERDKLLTELQNGRSASELHVAMLAETLAAYLQNDALPLAATRHSIGSRLNSWLRSIGERIGRKAHRIVIIVFATVLALEAVVTVSLLLILWLTDDALGNSLLSAIITEAEAASVQTPVWFLIRLGLQTIVGLLYGASLVLLRKREHIAVDVALLASVLSLTVVNLLTFYLDQFNALLSVAFTFVFFLLLVSYRSWYLAKE